VSPNKSQGEDELARQLDALKIPYLREHRFAPPRRWRFDFVLAAEAGATLHPTVWGIEVEGGQWSGGHRRGAEADKDCEKSNAAVMNGWRVLRFTPRMVECGEAIAVIEAALGQSARP
jgi:very-short-patch-repair endonuclease